MFHLSQTWSPCSRTRCISGSSPLLTPPTTGPTSGVGAVATTNPESPRSCGFLINASKHKAEGVFIRAAIELLLSTSDFKPRRTVILGFGHDEERGGLRGAPAIRDWLLETYGPDSMSLLVDEGSEIATLWGRTFGLPGVAEKGKFNLNITVATLGGHSSVPSKHTNIGLTSLLVAALERNPHPVILENESPVWGYLQCAATYAPKMPKELKKGVIKAQKSRKAFENLPELAIEHGLGLGETSSGMGDLTTALLSTTQATDIIYGGVKVNALVSFLPYSSTGFR